MSGRNHLIHLLLVSTICLSGCGGGAGDRDDATMTGAGAGSEATSTAQGDPDGEESPGPIDAFVRADGYQPRDVATVDSLLLHAFSQGGERASRADASASPLEKALLLVDALEPAQPRTRTVVRYGQLREGAGGGDGPVSFVTVERYNLGPAIREAAIREYGRENVAGPEEFGEGPHVSWRLVTAPVMGQEAALLAVGRRELTEGEARGADCAGRSCLAPDPAVDELHPWEQVDAGFRFGSAFDPVGDDGLAVPARAVAELSMMAGLAEPSAEGARWVGPEHPEAARGTTPFIFVLVERGLGQDAATDAVLGETLLNDDAVAELWYRRVEAPGMVEFMRSATARRR